MSRASPVATVLMLLSFLLCRASAQQPELRLTVVARTATTLSARLELTAQETRIAAIGTRIEYDAGAMAVSGLASVSRGSGLPATWSEAYANVSNPGEIDLVYTDVTPAAAVIAGPVMGLEVARIELQITGPCADGTAIGFSSAPPSTPQESAAFPVNQYIEYLDGMTSSVGLSPAVTAVTLQQFTLKVPRTSGPELVARLEATTLEGSIAAFGARLSYDPGKLAIASVASIEAGSAVPPSWTKVYANVSNPGEVDFVFTDVTPTSATIPGPLAASELCRIRFSVVAAPAGPEDIAFSAEPPATPQETAAFPSNHYFEYVDSQHDAVCLVPVEGRVVEQPLPSATAKLTLRLPDRFGPGNTIPVKVELTTDAPETFALGMRLTYDPAQVSLTNTASIMAGPGLPSGWTLSYANASQPARVDFVFSGEPSTDPRIVGPVSGLHVATLDFDRTGPLPEEMAFGFNGDPPSTPAEAMAFPANQFIRFISGGLENFAEAEACVVADRNGFIRGDCNADLKLDISDPIWHLNYLFRGGDRSPCDEACNVNSDAGLDISDSVYAISYLFQGGPPPAPPFPACDSSVYCAEDICP